MFRDSIVLRFALDGKYTVSLNITFLLTMPHSRHSYHVSYDDPSRYMMSYIFHPVKKYSTFKLSIEYSFKDEISVLRVVCHLN